MKKYLKLISLTLLAFFSVSNLYADEATDRWIKIYRDEIQAKEDRANEITENAQMIQRQIAEERKHLQQTNDRLYQDFSRNLELERQIMNEKMQVLDDRQRAFELELERKRAQDQIRMKDKERETHRLMAEMERLRASIKNDQVSLDRKLELYEKHKLAGDSQKAEETIFSISKDGVEELSHGMVKIGTVDRGEAIENKMLKIKEASTEYYVETGDVLAIEVWRVDDLTRDVTIRPDGKISMPLAGDIEVVGRSLTWIRDTIRDSISEYIIDPQVSITVRQFGGRKFVILGEIRGPGVYRYDQQISLIEAIALAGGFTTTSKSGQVAIIRGDVTKQPKVKIIKANMLNLLKGGMLTENLSIRSNDIIYVGKDFFGDYKDVLDQVFSPSTSAAIDFFVLRDAVRRVQNRSR